MAVLVLFGREVAGHVRTFLDNDRALRRHRVKSTNTLSRIYSREPFWDMRHFPRHIVSIIQFDTELAGYVAPALVPPWIL